MNSLDTKNNQKNNITNSGYTILEIILGTFAIVCIMFAILPLINYYNQINKSQAIADQAINYSKIFIKYLLDNDTKIRSNISSVGNDVVYIQWSTIQNGNYTSGNIASSNLLGQTPCMAVSLNTTTNQLTPYLFFVGGNISAQNTSLLSATATMNQIGAMAGVYSTSTDNPNVVKHGSGAFGAGLGWYLSSSSSSSNYISGIDQGCGDSLANNSIVINMAMMPEYASFSSSNDLSLHRYTDTSSDLGSSSNANTLQTDISLAESGATSSHKLYFAGNNESSGMYLWSNDAHTNLTLQNGGFSANTLQPTSAIATFTYCSADEVGTMALQSDTDVPVKSQLECTYDVLQCTGNDPTGIPLHNYCYLPTTSMSINYTPNATSFTCPVGYIDNSAPPVVNLNMPTFNIRNYYNCIDVETHNGSPIYLCLMSKNDNVGCIWAAPDLSSTYINPKSYENYTIYSGISYIASWDWVWQPGQIGYNLRTNGDPNIDICPQLTSAPLGIITSATCTNANPTVTYD